MSIHQETTLSASPERVYELLAESEKFAAATDMPATIGSGEGAMFSVFDGYIEGCLRQ